MLQDFMAEYGHMDNFVHIFANPSFMKTFDVFLLPKIKKLFAHNAKAAITALSQCVVAVINDEIEWENFLSLFRN